MRIAVGVLPMIVADTPSTVTVVPGKKLDPRTKAVLPPRIEPGGPTIPVITGLGFMVNVALCPSRSVTTSGALQKVPGGTTNVNELDVTDPGVTATPPRFATRPAVKPDPEIVTVVPGP